MFTPQPYHGQREQLHSRAYAKFSARLHAMCCELVCLPWMRVVGVNLANQPVVDCWRQVATSETSGVLDAYAAHECFPREPGAERLQ